VSPGLIDALAVLSGTHEAEFEAACEEVIDPRDADITSFPFLRVRLRDPVNEVILPNFNTSVLQVADLAGKNREIRGAWHHAEVGPGASLQGVGRPRPAPAAGCPGSAVGWRCRRPGAERRRSH
jgi:hypothetical protein